MTDRWQRQRKEQRVDSIVRPEGLRPRISRSVPTDANACRFSRAAVNDLRFIERSWTSGAWKFGSRSDDTDAAALPRSRLLADHDLDVLVEGGQQIHQTFH